MRSDSFRTEHLPARFASKVAVDDGCWTWIGRKTRNGYGRYYIGTGRTDQRYASAHRFAYELLVRPIPVGLELDHLCRTRACVNPAHLECVTRSENIRRGDGPSLLGEINGSKTHCPKGHPYDETNTYMRPSGGRACRQCQRDRRAAQTPEQAAESRRKGRERARLNRQRDPQRHSAAKPALSPEDGRRDPFSGGLNRCASCPVPWPSSPPGCAAGTGGHPSVRASPKSSWGVPAARPGSTDGCPRPHGVPQAPLSCGPPRAHGAPDIQTRRTPRPLFAHAAGAF